jgi:hypothetical protein
MVNNHNRTHVRSLQSLRYGTELFTSPRYEQESFISRQMGAEMLSPPLTPPCQKTKDWAPPIEQPVSPVWSTKKDSYLQLPISYKNYVPDMDESYLLNDRLISSLQLADQDVQSQQKRDQTWKKWIRRFRFVVRVLDLGCRFDPLNECDLISVLL